MSQLGALTRPDHKSLRLRIGRLTAIFRFSSEDDCRQAEMLAQQLQLAYDSENHEHTLDRC